MTARYRVRLETPARRSLKGVPARAIVVGVALASVLLAVLIILGKGHGSSPQVVARVGASEITVEDLKAEARAQGRATATPITPDLLEAVITRSLLAQEARRRGLAHGPTFVSERRRAEAQVLASDLLRVLPPPPPPPSDQVASYIKEHPAAFADRRRLVLDELRYSAVGAPDLQGLSFEDANARLIAAKTRFAAFQSVVLTDGLAAPLAQALASAMDGSVAIVRDGDISTAVRVVSRAPAPLEGLSAELAGREALMRSARERRLGELIRRLKQQTPPRLLTRR